MLDLAVGFKVRLLGAMTGFATAIVPLTPDGLRADVIPLAGLGRAF